MLASSPCVQTEGCQSCCSELNAGYLPQMMAVSESGSESGWESGDCSSNSGMLRQHRTSRSPTRVLRTVAACSILARDHSNNSIRWTKTISFADDCCDGCLSASNNSSHSSALGSLRMLASCNCGCFPHRWQERSAAGSCTAAIEVAASTAAL